jgi:geranylgeranyl pyrophosphate synthase
MNDVRGPGRPATASGFAALGFEQELAELRARVVRWIDASNSEIKSALEWHFLSGAKYFRPLTAFACYRSVHGAGPVPGRIMTAVTALELFHNMSLVVDDLVDKSPLRRGQPTLHAQFGELNALMTAGYIVAEVYRMLGDDVAGIALVAELMQRLAVAECLQWRLRRQQLGVEDWRRIAAEDTGSMFEICACLGDRSSRLRRFGGLLGILYHGCDDVGDVRGAAALGGGGAEDLRDGILTLPAALAIRDDAVAAVFCKPEPSKAEQAVVWDAMVACLDEAEAYLDGIAGEARLEARLFAPMPDPLLALVDETRQLSGG